MANPGVYPFDPLTEVGQFRVMSGDVMAVPLDPPVDGQADYEKWSDAEIEAFLATNTSLEWAIYAAFLQLATSAALEGVSIRDNDLAVDTRNRADALLKIANLWRQRAEDSDDASGGADFFDVFPTGTQDGFIPEGTMPVWGRQYTIGRWR